MSEASSDGSDNGSDLEGFVIPDSQVSTQGQTLSSLSLPPDEEVEMPEAQVIDLDPDLDPDPDPYTPASGWRKDHSVGLSPPPLRRDWRAGSSRLSEDSSPVLRTRRVRRKRPERTRSAENEDGGLRSSPHSVTEIRSDPEDDFEEEGWNERREIRVKELRRMLGAIRVQLAWLDNVISVEFGSQQRRRLKRREGLVGRKDMMTRTSLP